MMNSGVVYVGIGNSDDKLTQREWSDFVVSVDAICQRDAHIVGFWSSASTDPWQNACWCIVPRFVRVPILKRSLGKLAARFKQDSISWAEAPITEFLQGRKKNTDAQHEAVPPQDGSIYPPDR